LTGHENAFFHFRSEGVHGIAACRIRTYRAWLHAHKNNGVHDTYVSVARARATGLLLLATAPSSSQHSTKVRSGSSGPVLLLQAVQWQVQTRHLDGWDGQLSSHRRLPLRALEPADAGPSGHVPVQRRLIEKTATEKDRPGGREATTERSKAGYRLLVVGRDGDDFCRGAAGRYCLGGMQCSRASVAAVGNRHFRSSELCRQTPHTHTRCKSQKASFANEHAESYPHASLLFTSASIFRTHQKLLLLLLLVSC